MFPSISSLMMASDGVMVSNSEADFKTKQKDHRLSTDLNGRRQTVQPPGAFG
jgi:hypothetical protein